MPSVSTSGARDDLVPRWRKQHSAAYRAQLTLLRPLLEDACHLQRCDVRMIRVLSWT